MPYLTINSRQIFYTFNKTKADAPALVLLHGAGGNHNHWPQSWRHAVSTSARHTLSAFPVYALDLPGHGYSDLPGQNSINGYAQSVIDFINSLELKKVMLVGHSMGGAIAQAVGVRQPSNLAGLVLIGTGASLPVNPVILNGLQTDFPGTVQMIMKFAWHKASDPAPKQRITNQWLRTSPEIIYNDYIACNQFDVSHQLNQIQAPTLVVGSRDDKMTPLNYSQFLAQHIPQARLSVIEKAGHYLMIENTADVTAAILNFLKP